MHKQTLIDTLQLERHIEGGYFRRAYTHPVSSATAVGPRPLMSAIYYLLTDDEPVDHFHVNRSDILHFFHCGSPITYYLIGADGQLETHLLGNDLGAGQRPQLLVPGGIWKACALTSGEFGLLSEAVSPGFDYADMALIDQQQLRERAGDQAESLLHLVRS